MIVDVVETEVQEEVVLTDLVVVKVAINDPADLLAWEGQWVIKDLDLIMVQMDLAKMSDHSHLVVVEEDLDSQHHMVSTINPAMAIMVVVGVVIQITVTVINMMVQEDMVAAINLEMIEYPMASRADIAVEVLQMMAIQVRMGV